MSESLKLAWTDALSTGDPVIDVQHQYLINVMNRLADAIHASDTRKELGNVLNQLKHYAAWHFEREELCMQRRQCSALCANKEAHGKFMEMMAAYEAEFAAGGSSADIALRMHKTLTEWLVNHIQKVDSQLAICPPDDKTGM